MLDEKILRKKIVAALEPKRLSLRPFARDPSLDLHAMTEQYVTYGHQLEPHIADCARLVWELLEAGQHGALRGRPGRDARHRPRHLSVRDLLQPGRRGGLRRHRRRPAGHRRDLGRLQGLHDARRRRARSRPSWTTRLGELIRERGGEYGTTTGRARRTGWLDLVALRYAARLNTLSALAITKLDVLSGFDRVIVCTSYRGEEGAEFDHFPYHQTVLHHAIGELHRARGLAGGHRRVPHESRPAARRPRLSAFIADHIGVPVTLVGVGPGREQTIWTAAGRRTLAARNGNSPD